MNVIDVDEMFWVRRRDEVRTTIATSTSIQRARLLHSHAQAHATFVRPSGLLLSAMIWLILMCLMFCVCGYDSRYNLWNTYQICVILIQRKYEFLYLNQFRQVSLRVSEEMFFTSLSKLMRMGYDAHTRNRKLRQKLNKLHKRTEDDGRAWNAEKASQRIICNKIARDVWWICLRSVGQVDHIILEVPSSAIHGHLMSTMQSVWEMRFIASKSCKLTFNSIIFMPSLRSHHKQKDCSHMNRASHGNKNLCSLWCQSALGNRNSKSINRWKTTAIHTLRIHCMQIRNSETNRPSTRTACDCRRNLHIAKAKAPVQVFAYSSSINLNVSTWSCAIMQPVPEALYHWTARTICSIRLPAAASIRLFKSLIRIHILMERVRVAHVDGEIDYSSRTHLPVSSVYLRCHSVG